MMDVTEVSSGQLDEAQASMELKSAQPADGPPTNNQQQLPEAPSTETGESAESEQPATDLPAPVPEVNEAAHGADESLASVEIEAALPSEINGAPADSRECDITSQQNVMESHEEQTSHDIPNTSLDPEKSPIEAHDSSTVLPPAQSTPLADSTETSMAELRHDAVTRIDTAVEQDVQGSDTDFVIGGQSEGVGTHEQHSTATEADKGALAHDSGTVTTALASPATKPDATLDASQQSTTVVKSEPREDISELQNATSYRITQVVDARLHINRHDDESSGAAQVDTAQMEAPVDVDAGQPPLAPADDGDMLRVLELQQMILKGDKDHAAKRLSLVGLYNLNRQKAELSALEQKLGLTEVQASVEQVDGDRTMADAQEVADDPEPDPVDGDYDPTQDVDDASSNSLSSILSVKKIPRTQARGANATQAKQKQTRIKLGANGQECYKHRWEKAVSDLGPVGTKRPLLEVPGMPAPKRQKISPGKKADSSLTLRRSLLQSRDTISERANLGDLPGPVEKEVLEKNRADRLNALRKENGGDSALLRWATGSFGRGKCKPATDGSGRWELDPDIYRMESTLYNHQIVGVSWMLGRETCPHGPLGGFLADDMGLGKTIQVLATIAVNPPSREQKGQGKGATLVVCRANLISQWLDEAEKHYKPFAWNLLHYRKSDHTSGKARLQSCDVVFASYEEVAASFPNPKKPEEFRKKGPGYLHQIEWLRVVLDEAHAIKDHTTATSMACCALKSKYSWVVTGIPLMNRVNELFPYFKFIGFDDTDNLRQFNRTYGDLEVETTSESGDLAAIMCHYVLRRLATDSFLNMPIMEEMTTTKKNDMFVDLSADEQDLHDSIFRQYQKYKELKAQEPDPSEEQKPLDFAYFQALRHISSHRLLANCEGSVDDVPADIRGRLKPLQKKPEKEQCQRCGRTPSRSSLLQCGHTCCSACFINALTQAHADLRPATCLKCKQPLIPKPSGNNSLSPASDSEQENGAGEDARSFEPKGTRNLDIFTDMDAQGLPPAHSAKTKAAMTSIEKWLGEAPEDKIIVNTQWTDMARIMGRLLNHAGVQFLYYSGEMSMKDKDKAIEMFHADSNIKVLIMSLKCAVGLNLTSANRVLLMDLWYNSPVESQAVARVSRIGQQKPVHIVRILANGTYDEAVLTIQERKRDEIDQVYHYNEEDYNKITMEEFEKQMMKRLRAKKHDKTS